MSLNILLRQFQRQCTTIPSFRRLLPTCEMVRQYGIYEPDYLEKLKPNIPLYDTLNVQIKGYDYPVIEHYQKFVHHVAESMGIDVEDSWAVPPQHLNIQKYKPQSTLVEAEYKLYVYERNVQVVDLPSTVAPVFLEVIQAALPEGCPSVSTNTRRNMKSLGISRTVSCWSLKLSLTL